jgi:hypothetical protein
MRRGNGKLVLPPEEPGAREGEGGLWVEARAARQCPQGMLDLADRIRLLALEGVCLKRREDLDQELGEGLEAPEEGGERSNENLFIAHAQVLLT